MTIMMDTGSSGIDMASDNGPIGSSVSPVSRITVTGPISIAISRIAVAAPVAIAISRIAVTGPVTISRIAVPIAISRVAVSVG
jgi:hypothetical protein